MGWRLGLPQWRERAWVGSVYSTGGAPERWLAEYARRFGAVEGNSTFYALPKAVTVAAWAEQAPDSLRFCFKLPRDITHERGLAGVTAESDAFFRLMAPLGERLGPFMIQLPATFGPQALPLLQRFLLALPGEFEYAVEVRHGAFFEGGEAEQGLNELLMERGINRVSFDSRALFAQPARDASEAEAQQRKPRLPVRAVATGPSPIVRFVASNSWAASADFWRAWRRPLQRWLEEGRRPYLFIHAADNTLAPAHALEAQLLLEGLPGWHEPEPLQDATQLDMF